MEPASKIATVPPTKSWHETASKSLPEFRPLGCLASAPDTWPSRQAAPVRFPHSMPNNLIQCSPAGERPGRAARADKPRNLEWGPRQFPYTFTPCPSSAWRVFAWIRVAGNREPCASCCLPMAARVRLLSSIPAAASQESGGALDCSAGPS
jgi:hypothetical protein